MKGLAWIIYLFFSAAYCCTENTYTYKRSGENVEMNFQAVTTNRDNPELSVSNLIFSPYGSQMLSVLYKKGNHIYTSDCHNCTFIGDVAQGNIAVRVDNLQNSKTGTYKHAVDNKDTVLDCVSVFMLGVPTKPIITRNKDPSVGENVILTCSSTSTTFPSSHNLHLIYTWRFDGKDNPDDPRYSYSTNKRTLTLINVVKDDASKRFTCTAKEDVDNAETSLDSDSFSFSVLYGPEDVDFSPQTPFYERYENTTLESVTCSARCYPACSFKWTKVRDDTFVTNGAVLSLGMLSSSRAGIYRCRAMRTGGSNVTKDLTVNVIYGPSSMYFSPGNTTNRYNVNSDPPPITCNSSCWLCEYKWKGPNSYNSNGTVLDLDNLQRSMHGQYTCTATNTKYSEQRQEQKSVMIEVRYGPDRVNVTPAEISYTVDEDSTLANIKCFADCFPHCTYRWIKEGQNVVMSNLLPLGHINKSHTGNYTCTARNGDITTWAKEIRVFIQVRYGPYSSSTVLSPPALEHIRNEGGTTLPDIRCYADCFPKCTYTWIKSRQDETTSVATSDGVLSIGSLNRQDAGNYTCTATNPGKSSSLKTTKTVEIYVRYGPDTPTVSVQSPYTVNEGAVSDVVRCSADCFPGCSFSWLNETSRSKISFNSTISLGTVNRYMAGTYRCTSSNTAPEYSHSSENNVTVIVQYAPDVDLSVVPQNFTEGANVTLFCSGMGVPTKNHYKSLTQMVNGIQVKNTNKPLHGTIPSSIHFQGLHFEDTGTYTCTLNNNIRDIHGILDQTGSKDVIVEVLPKVLLDEMRFTGATSGNADIKVPVYSYPDLIHVKVTRYDGTEVESNDKYNKSMHSSLVETIFYNTRVSLDGYILDISVFNLEEDDFGNYSLKLTNSLGFTSVLFYIIAEGPPSPPLKFHYLIDREHPTFVWERNFNGGLEQSFVIQTAPDGTEQWTNHTNINENNQQYKMNSTFFIAEIRLQPGIYRARILANNSKGHSEPVDLEFTFEIKEKESTPLPIGAVVGGSVSAIVVAVVVAVVVLVWRRKGNKDGSKTHLNKSNAQDDDEDEVQTVNPMYVSADEVQSGDNTYAMPVKKKKNPGGGDVYAMVDKKKGLGKKDIKKNKHPNQGTDADIYENAPDTKGKAKKSVQDKRNAYEENPYENPNTNEVNRKQKIVNKEGLIYADLVFNKQPKGQKKLVIHGIDDMTEYVEVDFNKKADPLPESDEEDNTKK